MCPLLFTLCDEEKYGHMHGKLVSRNVTIAGHRTSLRLEDGMWAALGEICEREEATIHDLCTAIDDRRHCPNRTSAVRAFIVDYFRAAATDAGHSRAGHGRRARKHRGNGTEALERLFAG